MEKDTELEECQVLLTQRIAALPKHRADLIEASKMIRQGGALRVVYFLKVPYNSVAMWNFLTFMPRPPKGCGGIVFTCEEEERKQFYTL